jgi:hypothetical protein
VINIGDEIERAEFPRVVNKDIIVFFQLVYINVIHPADTEVFTKASDDFVD